MRRRLILTGGPSSLLSTLSVAALLACNQTDLDQDGDGFTELTGDCDDLNANVHPDALEVCENGIDDNCNGEEDEPGATSGRIWYVDLDGDGYGSEALTVEACAQPENYAAAKWDCMEDDPSIHPGAVETCDTLDNDCDGQVDEATAEDATTWYPDGDGDGYGDRERAFVACEPPGEGWISDGSDCADGDPLVSPEQTESCLTPYDDNCDGALSSEDAFGCTDWYADLDGDGHAGTAACLCAPEEPWTATEATDCNDTDPGIFPGSGTGDMGWNDLDCDGSVQRRLVDADFRFSVGDRTNDENAGDWLTQPFNWTGGDMDGDGLDDLVVAAEGGLVGVSGIHVASGASLSEQHALHEDATATLLPSSVGVDGATVWYAPHKYHPWMLDLDKDSLADLVVLQLTQPTSGQFQFEVMAFFGPLSGVLDSTMADAVLVLPLQSSRPKATRHRRAGQSETGDPLLAISDYDGAGLGGEPWAGQVNLYGWDDSAAELRAQQTIYGLHASQSLGHDVSDLGDINGDGLADRAVAADSRLVSDPFAEDTSALVGAIEVHTDETGLPSTMVLSNLYYENIVDHLAGPGDLDGDGYADLVFSAKDSNLGATDAGRVHVVWGPLPNGVAELSSLDMVVIRGDTEGQNVECPAVLPDTNGDGRDDLVIGAFHPLASGSTGATYLWLGARSSGTMIAGEGMATVFDELPDSGQQHGRCQFVKPFQRSAGTVGDVDGDGLGDLMIRGAVSADDDPERTDSLFLFLGGSR